MTGTSIRGGRLTEEGIKAALQTTRGDLFQTACMLSCTTLEVDRYIRSSDALQAFAASIKQVQANGDYSKMSQEQFARELEIKSAAYRVDGLEVLHKLAMMDHEESAKMADVRFKAAVALRGSGPIMQNGDGSEDLLKELNERYSSAAPRIRQIRAIQIDYEPTQPE